MPKISKYFTLNEALFSMMAKRKKIDNTPSKEILEKIIYFAMNTADKIRELFGAFSPSSWFRCEKLNKAVGGSATSDHKFGEAIDFNIFGLTIEEIMIKIIESGIIFDQLINEFDSWVHISARKNLPNRKQVFKLYYREGKLVKEFYRVKDGKLAIN